MDDTPEAMRTATRMPKGSNHSALPKKKRMSWMTRAQRRMMIMGSEREARNLASSGSRGSSVRELEPKSLRLCWTSESVSPLMSGIKNNPPAKSLWIE